MDAGQQEFVEFMDLPNQLEDGVSADRQMNRALSLVGGWDKEVLDHRRHRRRFPRPVDDSLKLSRSAVAEIPPGSLQNVTGNPKGLDAVRFDLIHRGPRLQA